MSKKILVVLTSHDTLLDGGPTGWYLPEFSHPYYVFKEAGYELDIASPKGGVAPLDAGSVEAFKEDKESVDFITLGLWKNTEKLDKFVGKSAQYDAIYYPGGHGPVFDLAVDKDSQELINEFYEAGKPVAAVCHGPAVFAHVKLLNGEPFVKGRKINGFTDEEEEIAGKVKSIPFSLEAVIKQNGGLFEKAAPWQEKVVVDEKNGKVLITGQNPASAKGVGAAIVAALKKN